MARILEALGKDVRVCNAFAVPPNLRFLDPQREAQDSWASICPPEQLDDREVLIVLDTTAWAQLGAMARSDQEQQGHQGRDRSSP